MKFKDLTEILQALDCKKPFDTNGNFTKEGSEAYSKLIDILYSISTLTESDDIETIVKRLDEISNE